MAAASSSSFSSSPSSLAEYFLKVLASWLTSATAWGCAGADFCEAKDEKNVRFYFSYWSNGVME
tara:strand:- start:371 stop:562 length:192 start_codon:yes stop_codon:yes gene_type:complete